VLPFPDSRGRNQNGKYSDFVADWQPLAATWADPQVLTKKGFAATALGFFAALQAFRSSARKRGRSH
jgi:hypothetical protein